MNCNDNFQRNVRLKGRLLLFMSLCSPFLWSGCAPTPEPVVAPAPAVDLYQLEADAGQALSLAQHNALRLDSLQRRLDSLKKQLLRTDSALAALPLSRMEENLGQVALLREDVQFLRQYLENQYKVPLINPPKKTAPTALVPAPTEYTQAMAFLDQSNYQQAIPLFESVPALYPKNEWSDDAWYWAGESTRLLGDYARAIAAYQKVLTYPTSDKHDDSQYGIAQCFLQLGDRERAAAEFRKVEVHYPQSDRIPQARTELKKLQSR